MCSKIDIYIYIYRERERERERETILKGIKKSWTLFFSMLIKANICNLVNLNSISNFKKLIM